MHSCTHHQLLVQSLQSQNHNQIKIKTDHQDEQLGDQFIKHLECQELKLKSQKKTTV